jgi:hypothetical protein
MQYGIFSHQMIYNGTKVLTAFQILNHSVLISVARLSSFLGSY